MNRTATNSGNIHLRAGFRKQSDKKSRDDIDNGEQTDSFRLHLTRE